jgi:hypothetical protein
MKARRWLSRVAAIVAVGTTLSLALTGPASSAPPQPGDYIQDYTYSYNWFNPMRDMTARRHLVSFKTQGSYWAVMGMGGGSNPGPSTRDLDLRVYNANNTEVGSSLQGGGYPDWVVINANAGCPGPQTYVAEISLYSGDPLAGYWLSLAQGKILYPNQPTLAMTILEMRDVFLQAGQRYRFSLQDQYGSGSGGIHLFKPVTPCVRNTAAADWRLIMQPNGTVTGDYIAPVSGWYGMAVSGLYRRTVADGQGGYNDFGTRYSYAAV